MYSLIYHAGSLLALFVLFFCRGHGQFIRIIMLGMFGIHTYFLYILFSRKHTRTEIMYDLPVSSLLNKHQKIANFQSIVKKNMAQRGNRMGIEPMRVHYYSKQFANNAIKGMQITNQMYQAEYKLQSQSHGRFYESMSIITQLRKQIQIDTKTCKANQNKYMDDLKIPTAKRQMGLQIVERCMCISVQVELQEISASLKSINDILNKCFSLTFAYGCYSQKTIERSELIKLISLIQRNDVVPTKYHSQISLLQLKKDIGLIKRQLSNVPNLDECPSHIKMKLYLKCLSKGFPAERIVVADTQRAMNNLNDDDHIFSFYNDGKVSYSRQLGGGTRLKTENCELLVLLFCLVIRKKYYQSKNSMLVDIGRLIDISSLK